MKIFKLSILLLIVLFSNSFAQQITVKADVDSSVITVGDPIKYTFTIKYDPKLQVLEPPIEIALLDSAKCEILGKEILPIITEKDGTQLQQWNYKITRWETGETIIPEIPVKYLTADSTEMEIKSNPIRLQVISVIAAGDTVKDIKGNKKQATIPKIYWYILWIVLALAAIAGAICGYLYWKRKKAANLPIFSKAEPDVPPEEIAYKELDRIETLRLWEQDQMKEHYDLVSDCIRRYIESRYKVEALELTTYEISRKLPKVVEKREHWDMIRYLLEESDLVKFAKYQPELGFAKRLLDNARKIVKETTPAFKLFEETNKEKISTEQN